MKARILFGLFFIFLLKLNSEIGSAIPYENFDENDNLTDLPYVILTNYSEMSPYYTSVQTLKDYRQATVVHFDGDILSVLDVLQSIQPKFVAIMVSPSDIDDGFAYKVFCMAKQMDTNFDTDFSYGFITGNSPTEVANYIDRVITYENRTLNIPNDFRCFYRTGEGAVGLSEETSNYMEYAYNSLGFESQRIDVDNCTNESYLNSIIDAGVMHFFLHGHVNLVEYLNYEQIPVLDHPVVVFNSGCYGGCTSKWYDQSMPSPASNNYEDRAKIVNPEESFALNFMKNGAIAYYGHMGMWGYTSWPKDLTDELIKDVNKSIGEILLRIYNTPNQPAIILDTVGTMPNDLYNIDNNRFFYSSIILYGDPAIRLYDLNTPPSINLSISPDNLNISSTAGSTTFTISSNTSWEITTTDNTWLTISPLSGVGDGVVTASWLANGSSTYRMAQIRLSGLGALTVPVWVFQFECPPPKPVLLQPINNALNVPNDVTFSWNNSSGANAYHLQVSSNSSFSEIILDQFIITETSFILPNLSSNSTYFWRVSALSTYSESDWADAWTFTTSFLTGAKDQISDELIKVYPIPVEGILKIDGIDKEYMTISILSQEGKLLKQFKGKGIQEIDVSELQKGVYLIKISNSQTVVTKKIVKL